MNKPLFERCIALSVSHVLNERQIGWAGRWCLMGDFVVCTQCLAAQPIDHAQQSFPHLPDCVAREYCLNPWLELRQLLTQLPLLSQPPLH